METEYDLMGDFGRFLDRSGRYASLPRVPRVGVDLAEAARRSPKTKSQSYHQPIGINFVNTIAWILIIAEDFTFLLAIGFVPPMVIAHAN